MSKKEKDIVKKAVKKCGKGGPAEDLAYQKARYNLLKSYRSDPKVAEFDVTTGKTKMGGSDLKKKSLELQRQLPKIMPMPKVPDKKSIVQDAAKKAAQPVGTKTTFIHETKPVQPKQDLSKLTASRGKMPGQNF